MVLAGVLRGVACSNTASHGYDSHETNDELKRMRLVKM
jgi:hypothetical protein